MSEDEYEYEHRYRYDETTRPASIARVMLWLGIIVLVGIFAVVHFLM